MKAFLDVNIFIYATGGAHPHQEPSARLLLDVVRGSLDAVTDTETLQELLYRYWHLRLLDEGLTLARHVATAVPTILPVAKPDLLVAMSLLTDHPKIEPRDAVHAAVMINHGITQLYSYDRHFDTIPGLKRLEP
jgi:predicted nucleic acid-binding protein